MKSQHLYAHYADCKTHQSFYVFLLQIKKLEELGIGRPSTYAATIKVLQVL